MHFGYNRNNFTFHVDDAFSADAIWNSDANCTPGEDCPRDANGNSTVPETSVRMTPADVAYAVAWEAAHDYRLTLPFNGFYTIPEDPTAPPDPLTQAFVANKSAFHWLNHGYEHLYQGCIQNFTVSPWACTIDANGTVYMSQAAIYNEIESNIANGQALGLDFDPTEYLSGEHSGLKLDPQQPTDNPNFAAALTQAGVKYIGVRRIARVRMPDPVGGATTIPRHPTALYYNTSTQAEAVDEYNWLYTSRANGGSGNCEDHPDTTTCITPLDPATGSRPTSCRQTPRST